MPTRTQVLTHVFPPFRLAKPSCSTQGNRSWKNIRQRHSFRTVCKFSCRKFFTSDLASWTLMPIPPPLLPPVSLPRRPFGGFRSLKFCSLLPHLLRLISTLNREDQRELGVPCLFLEPCLFWGLSISFLQFWQAAFEWNRIKFYFYSKLFCLMIARERLVRGSEKKNILRHSFRAQALYKQENKYVFPHFTHPVEKL